MDIKRILVTVMILMVLILALIIYSVVHAQMPPCINSDCDGNGIYDIDDVMMLFTHSFAGGPPCQPCEVAFYIGQHYIVVDTIFRDQRYRIAGDSLFRIILSVEQTDSLVIISETQIHPILISYRNIADTVYVGNIIYGDSLLSD
jgi:hypothetical protein